MFNWFKKKQKSCLGIDFGAASLKVVELMRDENERTILNNYILTQTQINSDIDFGKFNIEESVQLLEQSFLKAEIKTREAVISLSIGETFSTIIDLPLMSEEELAKAIPFQAKRYIPIPIEEVVLDWSIIGESDSVSKKEVPADIQSVMPGSELKTKIQDKPSEEIESNAAIKTMQVLVVAVPQEVIKKIAQIAKKTGLKILAVEQESFSIIRSLIGKDSGTYLIMDFGQTNIDLIIMDRNAIRLSYSFQANEKISLIPKISEIINLYQKRHNRKISRVILTGGGAAGQDLGKTIGQQLGIQTDIGNPFARLVFDAKLAPALKQIAPFMSVAVGLAMREI